MPASRSPKPSSPHWKRRWRIESPRYRGGQVARRATATARHPRIAPLSVAASLCGAPGFRPNPRTSLITRTWFFSRQLPSRPEGDCYSSSPAYCAILCSRVALRSAGLTPNPCQRPSSITHIPPSRPEGDCYNSSPAYCAILCSRFALRSARDDSQSMPTASSITHIPQVAQRATATAQFTHCATLCSRVALRRAGV